MGESVGGPGRGWTQRQAPETFPKQGVISECSNPGSFPVHSLDLFFGEEINALKNPKKPKTQNHTGLCATQARFKQPLPLAICVSLGNSLTL